MSKKKNEIKYLEIKTWEKDFSKYQYKADEKTYNPQSDDYLSYEGPSVAESYEKLTGRTLEEFEKDETLHPKPEKTKWKLKTERVEIKDND